MGGLDQFRTLIEDRNRQDLNLMERECDRLHDESDAYIWKFTTVDRSLKTFRICCH